MNYHTIRVNIRKIVFKFYESFTTNVGAICLCSFLDEDKVLV